MTSGRNEPEAVLVLGLQGACEPIVDWLQEAGLVRSLNTEDPGVAARLADLNAELIAAAGGSRSDPPLTTDPNLIERISQKEPLVRRAVDLLARVRTVGEQRPWCWYEPLNCFLAGFWATHLPGDAVQLLVVGDPRAAINDLCDEYLLSPEESERLWVDYHRAALARAEGTPTHVVVLDRPADERKLAEALKGFIGPNEGSIEAGMAPPRESRRPTPASLPELTRSTEVFWSVLCKVGENGSADPGSVDDDLVQELRQFYDQDYYEHHLGDQPCRRGTKEWEYFFASVADRIASTLTPKSVLDAGCAIGMLVEALRDRHVDARGFDISEFAISQAPEKLAPYVRVHSITDEIEGHFDLILCIEVVEHLTPRMAEEAIANICRHSDAVLFSSSPDDFDEATHINVRPPEDWARLFAHSGFVRDFDYDASYLAPQCVLFRRRAMERDQLIGGYERSLWRAFSTSRAQQEDLREQITETENTAAKMSEDLNAVTKALRETGSELEQVRLRRVAEQAAACDAREEETRRQSRLAAQVAGIRWEADRWKSELDRLYQTKVFRYTTRLRRIYGRMLRGRRAGPDLIGTVIDRPVMADAESYELWVEAYDQLTQSQRTEINRRVMSLESSPLISIVMPVFNPPERYLRETLESVIAQMYPKWELCIADDCSTKPHVARVLREYQDRDHRIRVVFRDENGHITHASNSALSLARGDWIALLDHDDLLAEQALALMALKLAQNPHVAYIYSDEDKIDAHGRRSAPFFKPEFDPVMLLGENYPCHLSVFRRDVVDAVGGFRPGFEGSQDWDLVLRVTERLDPASVMHLPFVLYHWRMHDQSTAQSSGAKSYAAVAGVRAVEDHLERVGQKATVEWLPSTGRNRVKWAIEPTPLVTLMIPTRDGRYLTRCIESVVRLTEYPSYEILVVDNGSQAPSSLQYLSATEPRIRVIRDERPFNYSQLNNVAAAHARGELLCLLNDDVEVMSGNWLSEMVGLFRLDDVGIVGAKLNYQDGTIQHAGVTLGIYGVAGHLHRGEDRFDPGYFGDLLLCRTVAAVTGACMLVRGELWRKLGGLDVQNLPIAFNDVDFCLRAREAGWRVVWTPFAELTHHESVSRGSDEVGTRAEEFRREVAYMRNRWGEALQSDPAYNPNLTLLGEHATLAWPPRVSIRLD